MKYAKKEHVRCKACGGCRHWHEWGEDRIRKEASRYEALGLTYSHSELAKGDCDKVPKGTEWKDTEGNTYSYDGYSLEDECYDEVMGCYED